MSGPFDGTLARAMARSFSTGPCRRSREGKHADRSAHTRPSYSGGHVARRPRGRRLRLIPTWMKVIRTIGITLLAAAIGAFVGYGGSALVDLLFG